MQNDNNKKYYLNIFKKKFFKIVEMFTVNLGCKESNYYVYNISEKPLQACTSIKVILTPPPPPSPGQKRKTNNQRGSIIINY